MDISIIIPCFNEEDNIPHLAERLKPVVAQLRQEGRQVEIVFVDDGSSDATFERLQAAFADDPDSQIVRHPRNQGLGQALRTGLKAARGQVIVTTDSDGTYDFASIPRLLAALGPDVDVVTASPYHPQGGGVGVLPAYRLALSRGCSLIYRLLVDRHLYTYTAIFRAYRRAVLENVDWGSRGYLAVTQMLVEARLKGYRVAEVPLVLNVRRYGQSKAKVARIMRDHLRYQMRLLARQVAARLKGQAWAEPARAPAPRTSGLEAK
jgi:dolichol-phosphate mannosyltransferase